MNFINFSNNSSHIILVQFSRSGILRRHIESGICKQIKDDEESEAPSENSESQQDDGCTDQITTLPVSKVNYRKVKKR